MLTRQAAKTFYDRFGSRQDAQAFYEDRALAELVAHADFESARHVFEFGAGTGRFADRLLRDHLSEKARYTGTELSTTMCSLASARLAAYDDQVKVVLTDGAPACPVPTESVDRIVTTYVLDLLPEEDTSAFLTDCARALAPAGRLCLVSLTYGETLSSRLVTKVWQLLFRVSPYLVGGCRPVRLERSVTQAGFRILHRRVVSSFGIASEVLVAEKLAPTRSPHEEQSGSSLR